jgi:hypothetical protein
MLQRADPNQSILRSVYPLMGVILDPSVFAVHESYCPHVVLLQHSPQAPSQTRSAISPFQQLAPFCPDALSETSHTILLLLRPRSSTYDQTLFPREPRFCISYRYWLLKMGAGELYQNISGRFIFAKCVPLWLVCGSVMFSMYRMATTTCPIVFTGQFIVLAIFFCATGLHAAVGASVSAIVSISLLVLFQTVLLDVRMSGALLLHPE